MSKDPKSHSKKNSRQGTPGVSAIDRRGESRKDKKGSTVVSVREYREMFADNISTDEQVVKRLRYLEALCRNAIKGELQEYAKKN